MSRYNRPGGLALSAGLQGEPLLSNSNSFDAIVVGTGISGGWAAKELTEKGLKTLVLERGRMVHHGDYPTAMTDPWDLPHANRPDRETRRRQHVQARTGYTANPAAAPRMRRSGPRTRAECSRSMV